MNAGGDQDEARPRARAPVGEASRAVEQARGERARAEYDCVDADGGNQKQNGPPPMIWRNSDITSPLPPLMAAPETWRVEPARLRPSVVPERPPSVRPAPPLLDR